MSAPPPAPKQPLRFIDPAEFTQHFSWRKSKQLKSPRHTDEEVFCEGVSLATAAQTYSTPAYLYSRSAIESAFLELDKGLASLPHTICFAVKANGNLTVLKLLAKLGSGFDIVSGGELEHLGHLGIPGNKIVFSGVGKTREEIREALRYRSSRGLSSSRGLLLFNIESEAELDVLLDESSKQMKRGGTAPSVAIRVNPDVQAGGHPHISTGHHEHKFGLDWSAARELYARLSNRKWIQWHGISAHIGSQITALRPFQQALARLAAFVRELRKSGIDLKYLDFGGGLGARYTGQKPPSRLDYARMIARTVKPLGLHLLLEPGRTIIANAGVLLTRVQYTKTNRRKSFVVVDAGMNDLLRPALYGAIHPITRVTRAKTEKSSAATVKAARVDVVGPVCETGDCFLRNWALGAVKPGDVLAIWTAGAYGMSLASNYNARPRPAEVLVERDRSRLIRRRETTRDLLRTDVLA
jgi:diaminopimelate decarboxylase